MDDQLNEIIARVVSEILNPQDLEGRYAEYEEVCAKAGIDPLPKDFMFEKWESFAKGDYSDLFTENRDALKDQRDEAIRRSRGSRKVAMEMESLFQEAYGMVLEGFKKILSDTFGFLNENADSPKDYIYCRNNIDRLLPDMFSDVLFRFHHEERYTLFEDEPEPEEYEEEEE